MLEYAYRVRKGKSWDRGAEVVSIVTSEALLFWIWNVSSRHMYVLFPELERLKEQLNVQKQTKSVSQ